MTQGCPVIASDRASMPEICGEAALYAPPTDPQPWCDLILRLRADPALRAKLVRAGHEQAKRFSWRRSAEIYLETMAEMDGLRQSRPKILARA